MTGSDEVGSLGEEAFRLLRALAGEAMSGTASSETDHAAPEPQVSPHVCTNSWCLLCQAVNYVRDHPEVVDRVTDAAVEFSRAVRDAIDGRDKR